MIIIKGDRVEDSLSTHGTASSTHCINPPFCRKDDVRKNRYQETKTGSLRKVVVI